MFGELGIGLAKMKLFFLTFIWQSISLLAMTRAGPPHSRCNSAPQQMKGNTRQPQNFKKFLHWCCPIKFGQPCYRFTFLLEDVNKCYAYCNLNYCEVMWLHVTYWRQFRTMGSWLLNTLNWNAPIAHHLVYQSIPNLYRLLYMKRAAHVDLA